MLITLTGMPGSGKTTVGRIVADALGCPFMDLDELIEKKAGKAIPAIFKEEGEAAFRTLEGKVLRETVSKYAQADAVLALGGGSVTLPGAAALLHEKTLCIWLQASIPTLSSRLQDTPPRPLLSSENTLEKFLSDREECYEKAAHVRLDTDGVDAEAVADELIITAL